MFFKNLISEEITRIFYKQGLSKTSYSNFRIEKLIKNVLNCRLNAKVMTIFLTVGLINQIYYNNDSIPS